MPRKSSNNKNLNKQKINNSNENQIPSEKSLLVFKEELFSEEKVYNQVKNGDVSMIYYSETNDMVKQKMVLFSIHLKKMEYIAHLYQKQQMLAHIIFIIK